MSFALSIQQLAISYGGIQAVKGVSLEIRPGEIVALIGANGAGKTSTLRGVVGLLPKRGSVQLFGQDITRLDAHEIAAHGVALVPEGRGVFTGMTVHENLLLGAYLKRDKSTLGKRFEQVFALFPRLKERLTQDAGTLSGGEQQMLAIGRALMAEPRLLLLDEPSLGLAPKLVGEIFAAIRQITQDGLTILLVEQNTHLALSTAQRAYVLVTGEVALHGPSHELVHDERIKAAYLGG
jgi:branched-chain amino acid transport system ATP-binding protein